MAQIVGIYTDPSTGVVTRDVPVAVDANGHLITTPAGGGVGSAVTIADGADVTQGAKADAVATTDTGSFSLIALFKRLLTKFSPFTNATTTAYAASQVVKASAGTLFRVNGYNSGPAQFLQVHNAAALPSEAAVPVLVLAIPATQNFYFDFGPNGRSFSTGIVICNSSTGPTKTIGSANLWLDTQFS